MSGAVKKILFTALRIFGISILVSFIMMGLVKCNSERPEETITILSFCENNSNFKEHLWVNFFGAIPVKVIASDSKTDVKADIVYFPNDYTFDEYGNKFNALETVRISNTLNLYVPYGYYKSTNINFNDFIEAVINNKCWSDLQGGYADEPIELKLELSSKEAPAFLSLLFDYFSDGVSYDKLTVYEKDSIINKMKDFISENKSYDINKAAVISVDFSPSAYEKVLLDQSSIVSERLVAITEHGKKYINDIREEYFYKDNVYDCRLIPSLEKGVVKDFINYSFDYEINTNDTFGLTGLYIVFGVLSLFFMAVFIGICVMDEELYLTPFAIFIVCLSILTFKTYLVTIILAFAWLLFDLWKNEFYELERVIRRQKDLKKKEKLNKMEEENRKSKFVEMVGEENINLYNDVIHITDEMIKFNKELGINNDVWAKIRKFVLDEPSSVSIIKGLFDKNIVLILDVYHQLPRNEYGKLQSDFYMMPRVREVLIMLNNTVSESFNEKKGIYHLDMKASLDIIENSIMSIKPDSNTQT